MENKRESILYKESPRVLHLIVYSAIAVFFFLGLYLLFSVEDIVEGWFEDRETVNVNNGAFGRI